MNGFYRHEWIRLGTYSFLGYRCAPYRFYLAKAAGSSGTCLRMSRLRLCLPLSTLYRLTQYAPELVLQPNGQVSVF